ncbi:hypothetical protein ACPPVO_46000 [Dactylosporangium sp. McL0621]|uniref:hypothetical protein n=1 Tax=Dactylosporangium sp. McL0621 TaxID=3415678 RepID=UPI003CEE0F43
MRDAFAHTALLDMSADADERAPGAAITVALCGALEHEPPCPLAAHHTAATRDGDAVRLRVLFASEPGDEARTRERIDAALAAGAWPGPDGVVVRWVLRGSGAAGIAAADVEHAERLRRPATA